MFELQCSPNSEFLDQTYKAIEKLPKQEAVLWESFVNFVPLTEFGYALSSANKPNKAALKRFDTQLAGQLFELLAHFYLSQESNPTRTLLSPRETFSVLTRATVEVPPFGESLSVMGFSMADGMLLKQTSKAWQVDRLYEYKAARDISRIQAQMRQYRHRNSVFGGVPVYGNALSLSLGRALHETRPDLPALPMITNPKMKISLVVPSDLESVWPQAISIPVSFWGLGQVFEGVITDSMWLMNH